MTGVASSFLSFLLDFIPLVDFSFCQERDGKEGGADSEKNGEDEKKA